jgi:hypothetical protein
MRKEAMVRGAFLRQDLQDFLHMAKLKAFDLDPSKELDDNKLAEYWVTTQIAKSQIMLESMQKSINQLIETLEEKDNERENCT